MKASTLSKLENYIRPMVISNLSPKTSIKIYSKGRKEFIERLSKETLDILVQPDKSLEQTLWGLKFRYPIFNSAGIFKNGECYSQCYRQGAGAYLL